MTIEMVWTYKRYEFENDVDVERKCNWRQDEMNQKCTTFLFSLAFTSPLLETLTPQTQADIAKPDSHRSSPPGIQICDSALTNSNVSPIWWRLGGRDNKTCRAGVCGCKGRVTLRIGFGMWLSEEYRWLLGLFPHSDDTGVWGRFGKCVGFLIRALVMIDENLGDTLVCSNASRDTSFALLMKFIKFNVTIDPTVPNSRPRFTPTHNRP